MSGTNTKPGGPDWAAIRAEYEADESPVLEILQRHGISRWSLYVRKHEEGWRARQVFLPGGQAGAARRLAELVSQQIDAIEEHFGPGEKPDPDGDMRKLHILTSAAQRMLQFERKDKTADAGQQRDPPVYDDATREALARRIEALVQQWETEAAAGSP